MAFSIGEAIIEIVGDSSKLSAELKHAESEGKGFVARMGITMKGLAGILIPGGIALGLAKVAMSAMEGAAQLQHLSEETGISVQDLSRMDYAAKIVGISTDGLAGALTRLSKQMVKGEDEMGRQSNALKKMGVNALDSAGKLRPIKDVLLDVADKFEHMNPAERLSRAAEIFGRGFGRQMIPMLAEGREGMRKFFEESDKVGYTLDHTTTMSMLRLEQGMKRLELMGLGVVRKGMANIVTAWGYLRNAFDDAGGKLNIGIPKWMQFGTIMKGITLFATAAISVIKILGQDVGYIAAIIQQSASHLFEYIKTGAKIAVDLAAGNYAQLYLDYEQGKDTLKQNLTEVKQIVDQAKADDTAAWAKMWKQLDDINTNWGKKVKDEATEFADSEHQMTDAEREATLAAKEQTLQRRIQAAELKNNWKEVQKLKDQLVDLEVQKMRMKGVPPNVIADFIKVSKSLTADEIKKKTDELTRAGELSMLEMKLQTAEAKGLSKQIRELTERKIELTAAEKLSRGESIESVNAWRKAALEEMGTKLAAQAQTAQAELSKFQGEIAKMFSKATMTAGDQQREEARINYEKMYADLEKFGASHVELWDQVHKEERALTQAYYVELKHIDDEYADDWRSIVHRIAEDTKKESASAKKDMETMARDIVSKSETAMTDVFFDSLSLNFKKAGDDAKAFFKDLLKQIVQFIARQEVLKFINFVLGYFGMSGATTSGSGFIGLGSSSQLGASSTSGFTFGGHLASGGIVTKNGLFEVGEQNKPEAVIPLDSERAKQFWGGAGGGNAQQPIDIHQKIVIAPELFAAMRTSPEEIVAVINGDYARNGVTRRTFRARG